MLLGGLAVIAPVTADDPVVTWPKAGAAPTSTVVPLSPYRPLAFDAKIPCATLNAIPNHSSALSTQPDGPPGLNVSKEDNVARFWVSGSDVFSEPLLAGTCTYRILSDQSGVRILRDGTLLASRPDLLPPQVAELATQAEGLPQAAGLSVKLHTDARYQSSPSTLKIALLIAHGCALVLLLVLAWRRWRGTASMRGLTWPKPAAADAVMVLVAAAWVFLGPANMDDSWYMMMARNANADGYIGNFVYMFNVTENPFVLSQYMLQAWGNLGGWSLWWMRLVPTACALITWFLLRVLFATLLGRAASLRSVPWALLVAHLVWFLPYGTTLRPEPVIVMCAAATLVFAEAAMLRRSIGALAVATVCAALAVTNSPSGVVAAAPLVLSIRWVAEWLKQQPWSARIAAVLLAAAATTVIVPIGFADATLGDVMEATKVHKWYYLSFYWFEEFAHYQTLLNTAGWARRLPVLLTLAVLVVVSIASGRGGMGRDPIRRLVQVSAITTAVALVLIAMSPTKWVNHFHAVAAAPTVLLAASLLRSPLPRRAGAVVNSVSIMLLVGSVSLSFAGNNWWIPFTDAGQRFGNHLDQDPITSDMEPHIGSLYLRNPAVWIAIALVAWAWAKWLRRKGKLVRIGPDRAVLASACLGSTLLMLALFTYAPYSQSPGWSVARSGWQTLFSNGCGMASDVTVQLPSEQQLIRPATPPAMMDDFTHVGPVTVPTTPWPDAVPVWHDDHTDGTTIGVGHMETGWYRTPPSGGTHVTVPVSGGLRDQDIEVQFGHLAPQGWQVTNTEKVGPDLRRGLKEWQQLSVPLPAPRPEGVRIVATDRITGAHSWIAVAEPKLTEQRPVSEVTQGKPVLANHIGTALWPCVNQVKIANGLTDTPQVRITTDENLPVEWQDNISNLPWGGAWVETSREWVQTELPAELKPGGPDRLPWGQVFAVRYLHPVGQFDLRVHQVARSGLERFPTLANNHYPDIARNPGKKTADDTTDSDGDTRDSND